MQEIALWWKNIYVTAMKSSDFAAMKNKMEIIKDVVKAGKSIRDFVSSSVDDLVTVRLKRLKDITLKKSLSKTMSQNAKYLLRQFSSDSALNFAASGVKIPWLKARLPEVPGLIYKLNYNFASKSLISQFKPTGNPESRTLNSFGRPSSSPGHRRPCSYPWRAP